MGSEIELTEEAYQKLLEEEIAERVATVQELHMQRERYGGIISGGGLQRNLGEKICEEYKKLEEGLDQLDELTGDDQRSRRMVFRLLRR